MPVSDLPMDMSIAKIGVDYLKLAANAHQLGYFSGFRFGSSNSIQINPEAVNVGGTITYFGSQNEMTYTRVNKYEVLLRCVIDHDKGNFDIGSFAFLVGPAQIPFFIGKLTYIHKKMATIDGKVGGRFTVQVKFKMYDMDLYWSYANLAASYAQADISQTSINDIPDTFVESPGYMLQIDESLNADNRQGYLLYAGTTGLSWRAQDLHFRHDDTKFFRYQAGADGDGHAYIRNT